MHARRSRFLLALLSALLLTLVLCAPAWADSLAVKRAEASRIEAQVQALNTKAEIWSEKYDEARVRYDNLSDKIAVVQARIAKLQKHQSFLQSHLNTRATDMYRAGPDSFLEVLLNVRSLEELDSTFRVLTSLNQQDAATVSQLKEAKAAQQQARATLVAARNDARKQRDAMAANAAAVKTQLAARQKVLLSVTAEIQALVAQQIAEQAAAEQARTMALLLRARSADVGGIILGGSAPSGSKAAAAVYWAEKEIGKPYVWAAAGPDTFDCSGLMVWAYGHVGIKLNHYSGDQIDEGRHISRSDLQPGDLVFFGSPIHHVGMYVGGGCFVEAPYTGADVRIARLSSHGDYAGACRPTER